MPFDEHGRYLDHSFVRDTRGRAASVVEDARRWLDPDFRPRVGPTVEPDRPATKYVEWSFRGLPGPMPDPLFAWLCGGDPLERAEEEWLSREFHAGRLLLGRCVSSRPDAAGRVIRPSQIRRGRVPVKIDHRGESIGRAGLMPWPHRGDVLAAVSLDDSLAGRQAARIVAEGASGLSIHGTLRAARGWNEYSPLEIDELSLVASPQDPTCRVLNCDSRSFLEFVETVLNIPRKELCP